MLEPPGEPDISVVIPCFNQAHFLPFAIESVLAQTYQNYEIIVVNDGSTDNTLDVAVRYPVRCISQVNEGLPSARNTGIRNSKGKFLVFLDADDLLTPQALETGRRAVLGHPEVAFVFGRFQRIDANGKDLPTGRPPLVTSNFYRRFLENNYVSIVSVMFRRQVFFEVGEFDTSLTSCEDYDLYLRVLRDREAFCHDEIVTKRRIHGEQMIKSSARMLRTVMRVHSRQAAFARRDPELASAFRKGRRHYPQWYGELLVTETHLLFRSRKFRQAMTNCFTLFQFYPRGAVALLKGLPESNHVKFSVGSEPRPLNSPGAHRGIFAITELHPWATPVGTGFNVQHDRGSTLGVVCKNASPSTTVIFDGEPLETAVMNDTYVTALVSDYLFSVEREVEVYLLK